MIEYKGYIGAVDFDPEIDLFHGTVINTNDVITFYGASVSELRKEMEKSVEGYLEFCRELGITPEKPFSGEFMIQMSPETHCKLALNAERLNLDFNIYLQEVLETAALETEGKTMKPVKLGPTNPNLNTINDLNDDQLGKKGTIDYSEPDGEWTIERVRDSVPQEIRKHYKSQHKERCSAFYKKVADARNLIQKEGWALDVKFTKELCGFWLKDKRKNKERRVFGIKITFNPPRFFAKITERDAQKLSNQYGCKMESYYSKSQSAFYTIPENLMELLPVFEFAYNKHLGN